MTKDKKPARLCGARLASKEQIQTFQKHEARTLSAEIDVVTSTLVLTFCTKGGFICRRIVDKKGRPLVSLYYRRFDEQLGVPVELALERYHRTE